MTLTEQLEQDPFDGTDVAGLKTYRYLRIGLVGAVVLLITSMVIEAVDAGCLKTSMSSYYYSPTRTIFVGSLMVMGFGLIVLRGRNDFEDILLNVAGMLAPVVAVVPTTSNGGDCLASNALLESAPKANTPLVMGDVDNNVWSLIAAGLVAVVAAGIIAVVAIRIERRHNPSAVVVSRPVGIGLTVVGAILVAATLFYLAAPGFVRDKAHGSAAVAMFVPLGVVSLLNSRNRITPPAYKRWYRNIALAMAAGAVVGVVPFRHRILALETVEILLFALYWSVQTKEHWRHKVMTRAA